MDTQLKANSDNEKVCDHDNSHDGGNKQIYSS